MSTTVTTTDDKPLNPAAAFKKVLTPRPARTKTESEEGLPECQ